MNFSRSLWTLGLLTASVFLTSACGTADTQVPSNRYIPKLSCEPLQGVESLAKTDGVKWILVGEEHGTEQYPKIFGDLVCQSAKQGQVVVALEVADDNQPFIEKFLKSETTNNDEIAKLLKAPMWYGASKDGKGSRAYLELISYLRDLYQSKAIEGVYAFVPSKPTGAASYEDALAINLQAIPKNRNQVVYALTGNFHSMTKAFGGMKPLGAILPRQETIGLLMQSDGGKAWNCSSFCGVQDNGVYKSNAPKGVTLDDAKVPGYDGVLYIGTTTTASLPAIQD